jgi:ADP-ribosylglycohydrolase
VFLKYLNTLAGKLSDWASPKTRDDQPSQVEVANPKDELSDRCRGAIYGHAIGDALGLGAEFMSKAEVMRNYPTGLHAYSQIVQDRHRSRWAIGDWTDDTDQMLCILDSILDKQDVDILDIAQRMHSWATNDGMGIGNLVFSVLSSRYFLTAPHFAASCAWELSGRHSAPNGGVMRTSILGVWKYQSLAEVKKNAEKVCRITHYDPRCVGSCVAVCIAISLLLQGKQEFADIFNIVCTETTEYSPEIAEYLDTSVSGSLEDLDLDEGLNPDESNRLGYTLKALSAGFWALKNALSYRDGVLQVIHEGGDADTNAAVVGAMLGAKYGFSSIPVSWVNELRDSRELGIRAARMLALLNQEKTHQIASDS